MNKEKLKQQIYNLRQKRRNTATMAKKANVTKNNKGVVQFPKAIPQRTTSLPAKKANTSVSKTEINLKPNIVPNTKPTGCGGCRRAKANATKKST